MFLTQNQNLADNWPSAWSVKIRGSATTFGMHLKYAFLSVTEHICHQKSFLLTLECGVQLPYGRDINLFEKNAHNSETIWNSDIYLLLYPKKQDPDTMIPYTRTEKGIG